MPRLLPICTLLLLLTPTVAPGQTVATPAPTSPPTADVQPLPDIPTLMRQVEIHQRDAEKIEKDYIYRAESIVNELDDHGGIKKTKEQLSEIFWLNRVQVQRVLRKDNKNLSPDDLKKENDRIDKEVAKARERRDKSDAEGKETDSHGHDEITVSRILELGTFSNPRRVTINGRPTIAIDYTGDPGARTHNAGEAAIKLLAGTVWVDEQDKVIQHAEGRFTDNFKIGAGLVASIHKDTSFTWSTIRINDEVWLPATIDAHGFLRYLLFFSVNGDAHFRFSDYHKFKATSTILPGFTPTPPEGVTPNPATPTPPPPASPP